jgi:hypothetical protein
MSQQLKCFLFAGQQGDNIAYGAAESVCEQKRAVRKKQTIDNALPKVGVTAEKTQCPPCVKMGAQKKCDSA